VVAEIVGVGEPSGGEITRSVVDHGSQRVPAEGSDAGCRQGGARDTCDPCIDVSHVLADGPGSGRIGRIERAGPIAPLQELARAAEAVRQQGVGRYDARGYLRTEARQREIRNAFSCYMSPRYVQELAAHPEKLVLGGETRMMTIMFCDIRGFTSLAEGMDARTLTRFMNSFLAPMTEIITRTERNDR
jgi:hypothetical protein